MRILIVLFFFIFATLAHAGSCVPGIDEIIIAGQSNAEGMGKGPFHDPLSAFDNRIRQIGRYQQDYQIINVGITIDGVLYDGLQHWGRDFKTMGAGLTFARRYAGTALCANRKVVIIPAAHGNTSILEWLGVLDLGRGPLFSDMIARAKYVLGLPGTNRIVAVLWDQLEDDVDNATLHRHGMTPTIYLSSLRLFLQKLRAALPKQKQAFPIILGKAVPTWESSFPAKHEIERYISFAAQRDLFADAIDETGFTSNADFGYGPDAVHFNAQSQVQRGLRFFNKYQEMITLLPQAGSSEYTADLPSHHAANRTTPQHD